MIAALVVVPIVLVLVLCWLDPAGHYAAEERKRAAERTAERIRAIEAGEIRP